MSTADPGTELTELLTLAGALPAGEPVRHIVTHGAVIVLCGDRAWKLKRPVRYRYLDFSTVELRGAALRTELELNRRTAPQLYLAVHTITRDADDSLTLDGDGAVVDWALEMLRFPDDAVLAERDPGTFDDALVTDLAAHVADLHADAEVIDDPAGAARLLDVVEGNLLSMGRFPQILDPARAELLTQRQRDEIAAAASLLDRRAADGRVRLGHGDLHLGNIALLDGQPVPFDCLEFDPELATADVLYDLAFLLMDLWARGLRHGAAVVLNAYLDLRPEEENGLGLLPLLLSVRATVRAHVLAAAGDPAAANGYLDLALAVLERKPLRLIAIGGGSGTGKSTLARAIGGDFGTAPGLRILRSDVLRKRLAGVPATQRLPAEHYTPAASARVYDELRRLATEALAGGMSVVVDAVSGHPHHRQSLADTADEAGAEFTGIWLELSEAQRISRIDGRGPDASDATAEVARAQTTALVPPGDEWTHLAADETAADRVRDLLTGA